MSQEVDVLQQVVAGVNDQGDTYTQPVVSRYYDAWERMSKRRQSLLDDLLATRKSKKGLPPDVQDDEATIMAMISQSNFLDVEKRPEKFKDLDNQED